MSTPTNESLSPPTVRSPGTPNHERRLPKSFVLRSTITSRSDYRPEALTNLFVGLFVGSVLYSFQRIQFKPTRDVTALDLILYLDEAVYLVYLILGYFTLFRTYHRDSPFFRRILPETARSAVKTKYTALTLVLALLAFVPHLFSLSSLKAFYPLLFLTFILDIVWLSSYRRVLAALGHRANSRPVVNVSRSYIFDLSGIFTCAFCFVLVAYWHPAGQLFGHTPLTLLAVFVHLTFLLPFFTFYIRSS